MTPEQIREQEESFQAERARQAVEDLRKVMETEVGRRFVWSVVGGHRANGMRDCFRGEDTHGTAYLEGRRSIGLELMHEVQRVARARYTQMVTEAAERSNRELDHLDRLRQERGKER